MANDHRQAVVDSVNSVRMQRSAKPDTCAHDWQQFRETIQADNPKFRGSAHFIVQACIKCKEKRRTSYVLER